MPGKIALFVGYDIVDAGVYVCLLNCFRGSMQLGDVMTDVSAQPILMHFGEVVGKVHEGLLSAATYVHCSTAKALAAAAKECPGWPLLVAGHSLGGK